MSTRVLYLAIGLDGYRHVAAWDESGQFKLRLQPPESAMCCPGCRSTDVIRRGTVDRMVHAPLIGLRKTVVFIRAPRVECRRCQTVRVVHLPSVVPHCNHTKSFAKLVVDLRKMMTIQDVARYLGVSTTMILQIDKRFLKRHFSKPILKNVRVIAIDEISIRKGYTDATIVMDLESGAIIFVEHGKGEKSLEPF